MDRYLTTDEAAILSGVTRQAVYLAIKKNRLKAERIGPWYYQIKKSDLDEYRENRFCRDKSTFEGEPLYDAAKGEYSLKNAAAYLGMDYMNLYYHMRAGRVSTHRKGAAWIFHRKDLDELRVFLDARERVSGEDNNA